MEVVHQHFAVVAAGHDEPGVTGEGGLANELRGHAVTESPDEVHLRESVKVDAIVQVRDQGHFFILRDRQVTTEGRYISVLNAWVI